MPTEPPHAHEPKAEIIEVGPEQAGQRIDNFLIKHLKGVPKTRLYRALRGGEVRVNGGRKKAPYQLRVGDRLRIPPIRRSERGRPPTIPPSLLAQMPVLYEDEHLLVVDKPSGLAAHGGSGLEYGLIEALRALRPKLAYLELAHRLDRETSGCLALAKNRAALRALHEQWGQERGVVKQYVALLKGAWQGDSLEVDIPLAKSKPSGSPKQASTRGHTSPLRPARSVFSPRRSLGECAVVGIRLITGRMHQARAHAAAIGRPIAGDHLYGDAEFNRITRQAGLTRLFLHAERLHFCHPLSGAPLEVYAALPASLELVLDALRTANEAAN